MNDEENKDTLTLKESRKTKKEIVKKILQKEISVDDDEELLDLLIDQPIAIDIDKQEESKMTTGDKIADKLSEIAGSWTFIGLFVFFLIGWIVLNYFGVIQIDNFPFTLLNLLLSCIAALQAPVIMMSQNRQAKKDSLRNLNDYRTDLKSELISEEMHHQLEAILKNQKEILKYLRDDEENKK